MAIVFCGYKEEDPRIHSFAKIIPQDQFRKEDRRRSRPGEQSVKIAYPVVGLNQMPDTHLAPIPFRVADRNIDRAWNPELFVKAAVPECGESAEPEFDDFAWIERHREIARIPEGKRRNREFAGFLTDLAHLRFSDPDRFFDVKNRLRLERNRLYKKAAERTLLVLAAPTN